MLAAMHTYLDFEVSLLEIDPRIWRRFQLGADDTFGDLHVAIQDSFDWDKDHMWVFRTAGRDPRTLAGPGPSVLDYESDEIPDAWEVKLSQHFRRVSMTCRYTYDFGDNWVHAVKLRQRVTSAERFGRASSRAVVRLRRKTPGGPLDTGTCSRWSRPATTPGKGIPTSCPAGSIPGSRTGSISPPPRRHSTSKPSCVAPERPGA